MSLALFNLEMAELKVYTFSLSSGLQSGMANSRCKGMGLAELLGMAAGSLTGSHTHPENRRSSALLCLAEVLWGGDIFQHTKGEM